MSCEILPRARRESETAHKITRYAELLRYTIYSRIVERGRVASRHTRTRDLPRAHLRIPINEMKLCESRLLKKFQPSCSSQRQKLLRNYARLSGRNLIGGNVTRSLVRIKLPPLYPRPFYTKNHGKTAATFPDNVSYCSLSLSLFRCMLKGTCACTVALTHSLAHAHTRMLTYPYAHTYTRTHG